MEPTWIDRLKVLVLRNRPSQKPQLWEDFPLAARRRVELELYQRTRPEWLDTPHVVDLSRGLTERASPPIRMSLMLRDRIARALFLYGTYELTGTRLLQAFLRAGMAFVDVGANIGYYSLLAARAVGDTGSVYAFEPNAAVRTRLEENLHLNGPLAHVHVRHHAVTRLSGEIQFYRSNAADNSGLSSTLPGAGRCDEAEVVPSVSLDDFAASLTGPIDLMKIDVEGAELEVLAGGQRTLARDDAPAIIFESQDIAAAGKVLGAHGYAIRRPDYTLAGGLEFVDPEAPFHSIFDDYEPPNYFATKDVAEFDRIAGQANARSSGALRFLGRL